MFEFHLFSLEYKYSLIHIYAKASSD